MIKNADLNNFDDLIKEDIVLVDFYATWCGPCKMLSPILEDMSSTINIVKVDIDNMNDIARKYGVMAVPTLILFKNGKEVKKQVGFMSKDMLTSWINSD